MDDVASEFNPSGIKHDIINCSKCGEMIDVHCRFYSPIGYCRLCRIKPTDKCYCEYEFESIVYSCHKCRIICQRCGGRRVHYFNERKWRGSGKTKNWIKAYNRNRPFRFEYLYELIYPQDLCDKCIDLIIGKIWNNYIMVDPYNIFQ